MPLALVTGASGYIGQRLVYLLLKRGWRIDAACGRAGAPKNQEKISWISNDPKSLSRAITESNPDIIIHLATLYIKDHKTEDIPALIDSNITFITHLADAAAQAGCKKFINIGTAWQHAQDGSYQPANLYAATKQASESIIAFYQNAGLLDPIHLHLFDTYGPNDPRPKIFNLLQKTAMLNGCLEMSPGDQILDLLHVDDAAAAIAHAADCHMMNKLKSGTVFGISSGRPLKLKELVELWITSTGINVNIKWGALPYRTREVMRPWEDPQALPHWKPIIAHEIGFRTTFSTTTKA